MRRVYIFGNNSLAEMLWFYLSEEGINVEGYTLNKAFIDEELERRGDFYAIEDLLEQYPAQELYIYVSIAYKNMNQVRKSVFEFLKGQGVNICTYIHPSAVIAQNVVLGVGNIILENSVLQPYVEMGDGNIIWSNVNISHHDKIGDFNYFSPGVTVAGRVQIGALNFLGANCVVSNDIFILERCLVGAGAYVKHSMQPEQVMVPSAGTVLVKKSLEMRLQ